MTGILDGVRILDLSGITAGGRTTQIMGDYGADVIKLEGPQRPDPFRHWTVVTGSSGHGDLGSPPFRVVNRNKRGMALDLKHPESAEVIRRLVEWADIVVENFRRGVMDRLGLGFDTLVSWNPDVVLLSLSSQGPDGPESGYVSFGSTLEALGGQMALTGYDSTTPTWSTNKVNYPDQTVSVLAPGLAIWALMQARATGQPYRLDLSQRELVTSMLGEWVVDAAATGVAAQPTGNRGEVASDFCLACAGEDQWLVLSIENDSQWHAVAAAVGQPELATDPRFADESARVEHHDELEAVLASWTAGRSRTTVRDILAGLAPSAPVLSSSEVIGEFGTAGVDFYAQVPLPDGGTERQISWPFDLPGSEPSIRRRAPHVGEHTREIMAELGFDEAQTQELFATATIADLS